MHKVNAVTDFRILDAVELGLSFTSLATKIWSVLTVLNDCMEEKPIKAMHEICSK